jgi:hypothetical protein
VTRSLACRDEQTVALDLPRAADFLSDAGVLGASCMPGAAGDLAGWPDPTQGARVAKCQLAIDKASLVFGQRALAATEKCLGGALECRWLAPLAAPCIADAAPRCRVALAKVTDGGDSVLAKERVAIGRACGGVAIGQLTSIPGLGFALGASRCAALGVPSLDAPADVATCVLRGEQCAAADVSRAATPRIDEYLADLGASSAPAGFTCPAFPAP